MSEALLNAGRQTLMLELQEASHLPERLGDDFVRAANIILHCEGKVVVSGIGKSGHIGKKIAATLASTGTPAFFVHPAEALHGDLGMIESRDVMLLSLIPVARRNWISLFRVWKTNLSRCWQ